MHGLFILAVLGSMLIGVASVVFWVWTLIDCVTNKRISESQKVMWALIIFFVGIIGSVIYFFAGRTPSRVYVPVQPYAPAQSYAQPVYGPPPVEQAPVESYPEYQQGYRVQEQPRPAQDSSAAPATSAEQHAAPQQVQHEHIQISYPE